MTPQFLTTRERTQTVEGRGAASGSSGRRGQRSSCTTHDYRNVVFDSRLSGRNAIIPHGSSSRFGVAARRNARASKPARVSRAGKVRRTRPARVDVPANLVRARVRVP